MTDSSQDWAASHSQGGAAIMIEQKKITLRPTITQELDEAFSTFVKRVGWMIKQGWEGQWVAISGTEILDHGTSKRDLAKAFASLYEEKKLLLRRVFPLEKRGHTYSLF